MNSTLTKETIHADLIRTATRGSLSEEDGLLWMILFHTHNIRFRAGAVEERRFSGINGDIEVVSAQTQRSCAGIIASVWPDTGDEHTDYKYWYFKYSTRVPYEFVEEIPQEMLSRIQRLKAILEMDPRVIEVVPEQ